MSELKNLKGRKVLVLNMALRSGQPANPPTSILRRTFCPSTTRPSTMRYAATYF